MRHATERLAVAQAMSAGLVVHARATLGAVRGSLGGGRRMDDDLALAIVWAGNDLERALTDLERVRLLVRAPEAPWGGDVEEDPADLVAEISTALGETGAPWRDGVCGEGECEHDTCAVMAALRAWMVGFK